MKYLLRNTLTIARFRESGPRPGRLEFAVTHDIVTSSRLVILASVYRQTFVLPLSYRNIAHIYARVSHALAVYPPDSHLCLCASTYYRPPCISIFFLFFFFDTTASYLVRRSRYFTQRSVDRHAARSRLICSKFSLPHFSPSSSISYIFLSRSRSYPKRHEGYINPLFTHRTSAHHKFIYVLVPVRMLDSVHPSQYVIAS